MRSASAMALSRARRSLSSAVPAATPTSTSSGTNRKSVRLRGSGSRTPERRSTRIREAEQSESLSPDDGLELRAGPQLHVQRLHVPAAGLLHDAQDPGDRLDLHALGQALQHLALAAGPGGGPARPPPARLVEPGGG